MGIGVKLHLLHKKMEMVGVGVGEAKPLVVQGDERERKGEGEIDGGGE